MTKEQLYDLAIAKGVESPAVLQFGRRFIVGRWTVALAEVETKSNGKTIILPSRGKGIEVLGEGDSWLAAAASAGFVDSMIGLKHLNGAGGMG